MPLPHWLAVTNRRLTNHVLGRIPRRFSPFVLVRHAGRNTGKAYQTPLAGFRTENGIILTPTYGPSADWVKNVIAGPSFQVDRRGTVATMTNARLVGREEAWPYLPALVRLSMRLLRIDRYVRADRL